MPQHTNKDASAALASVPVARRYRLLRLLRMAIFALAAVLAMGLLLFFGATHLQSNPEAIGRFQDMAGGVKSWGALVQTALLGAIVMGWRHVVAWMVRRRWLLEAERERALDWRWRVLAFGAAYLLLAVIGPSALWRALVA